MYNSMFLRRLFILIPSSFVFCLGLTQNDLTACLLGLSLLAILGELINLDSGRHKNYLKKELSEMKDLKIALNDLKEQINKLDEKVSNSCWY
jgi:hypothetical protein